MSRDNEEIIRRHFEAFNRGDLGAIVADFAPEFEYVTSGVITDAGRVYRGHEEYVRFVEQVFLTEFSESRAEINQLIDAEDQILVTLTVRGRGKQSRAETSWTFSQLWTVRDGMVTHGWGFESWAEALDAAGLRA